MASSRGAMVTVGQASYGSTNVLTGYNFLSGNIVCIFPFNNTNFKELSQCLKMVETLIVLGSMMGDFHLFYFLF